MCHTCQGQYLKMIKLYKKLTIFLTFWFIGAKSIYCAWKWSAKLIVFEKQKVIGSASRQLKLTYLLFIFILPCSRPMELNIRLQLWIKTPCGSWSKSIALLLTLNFGCLTPDLFIGVLLGDEWLCGITPWPRHIVFRACLLLHRRKLALSGTKSSNISLPVLSVESRVCSRILLGTRVRISTKKHVFPIRRETCCVCPPCLLGLERPRVCLVRPRPQILILALYKVLVFNLVIGCSKELEEILLVHRSKVTLLDQVLMSSWLDLGLHVLLPHDVSLLLVGILRLGLCRHFLHKSIVVLLPSVLVI